jgi:glycosyltransferase involved in cell wall biosynthesis
MENGGVRTKSVFKESSEDRPLISVITVVYNAAGSIERTITSVLGQTYTNIEYIIVDGASTDETLSIIRKYEEQIDYWVSEKDDGIYDAMNKGISLAKGEWINFMNVGDYFYDEDVVETLFASSLEVGAKVIYGDAMQLFPRADTVRSGSQELVDIKCGPTFIHQCTFTHSNLAKQYPFDLEYKICADYDFFYKMYTLNIPFQKVDMIIAYYDMTGISSHFFATYKEIRAIQKKYVNGQDTCVTRKRLLVIACKEVLKKILPNRLVDQVRVVLAKKREQKK